MVHTGILFSHKKEWNFAICTTWMNLEGIMLCEICQRNTLWFHLHVESKKAKLTDAESTMMVAMAWGVGNGKMLAKVYKLLVIRWVSSGDLMYSMVTRKRTTYTMNFVVIRKHFKSVGGNFNHRTSEYL